MLESEDFMTVAEVASILKLNQQTVRNWIDAGKLPALHIGQRVRIRRIDFNALLEASIIRAAPAATTSIWDDEIPLPEAPNER